MRCWQCKEGNLNAHSLRKLRGFGPHVPGKAPGTPLRCTRRGHRSCRRQEALVSSSSASSTRSSVSLDDELDGLLDIADPRFMTARRVHPPGTRAPRPRWSGGS